MVTSQSKCDYPSRIEFGKKHIVPFQIDFRTARRFFGIICGMSRWFNIGGPCIAAKHYMLPASKRLPDVWSLIRKEQYFVVHAPRQCGKTTAFRALMDEINGCMI